VKQGHSVLGLGRNQKLGRELQEKGVRFEACSILDGTELEKNFANAEVVIHSAGYASPFGRYEDFYESNVIGTTKVMEAARVAGTRRVINISSPSVYFDYSTKENIRESDPLPQKQVTYYGKTKLAAEMLAHDYAKKYGIEIISLRPKGVIGEGDQNYLPRLMRAQTNGRILVVGDGQSHIDLTCIENATAATRLAVEAGKKLSGKTYNITNGEPLMTDVFLTKLFKAIYGEKHEVKLLHVPYAIALAIGAAMENYYRVFKPREEPPISSFGIGLMGVSNVLNIDEAKKDLGYAPKVPLEEGIRQFANWWKRERK